MYTQMLLLFVTICLFPAAKGSLEKNLWDQVVRQEQVILTVIYKGRSLSVWKQEVDKSYSRYYVTPLCTLDKNSLSCERDDYGKKPRSVFAFKVKLWDLQVATFVQKALKSKNIIAHAGDIFILPMQSVRIGLGNPTQSIKIDENWRPFGDESLVMSFQLYPKTHAFCLKMLEDAKTRTDFFLSTTKLYFEFMMTASTTSSRHIKISATSSQKSSFYSNLVKNNADENGDVYLKSEDANKLAHEIFNSASFDEEVSSDYDPSENENAIIKELLKNFQHDKIQSKELTKEKWDSVFWDDIFTRPDIQTSFLNDTITFDGKENNFHFDQQKAEAFRNKVVSAHSNGHTDSMNVGASVMLLKSKNDFNVDDFNKALEKNKWNVKWTGKKFEQINLDLYRINTKNIQSTSETAFNRVIVSKKETGQKIEIKEETDISEFDHIYDETTTISTTTTNSTATPPKTITDGKISTKLMKSGRRLG